MTPFLELLFVGRPFAMFVRDAPQQLVYAIETLTDSELIEYGAEDGDDDESLIERLIDRHRLAVPVLDTGSITLAERVVEADASGRMTPGADERASRSAQPSMMTALEVTFRVPFKGDADLFRARPSQFDPACPAAVIADDALMFIITRPGESSAAHRRELDRMLLDVDRHLAWLRSECLGLETKLQQTAADAFRRRRDRWRAAAGRNRTCPYRFRK